MTSRYAKFSLAINLIEVPQAVPMLRLVMFGREKLVYVLAEQNEGRNEVFMSYQSLKMTTCSLRTESVKQGDAFGPDLIQCSLQVHVQEVHHGTESTDG